MKAHYAWAHTPEDSYSGKWRMYCNLVILYFHTVRKSCGSQSKTISWLQLESVIWSPSLTWEVFKASLIESALFTYFSCFDGSAFLHSVAFLLPLFYTRFLAFYFFFLFFFPLPVSKAFQGGVFVPLVPLAELIDHSSISMSDMCQHNCTWKFGL